MKKVYIIIGVIIILVIAYTGYLKYAYSRCIIPYYIMPGMVIVRRGPASSNQVAGGGAYEDRCVYGGWGRYDFTRDL